MSDRNPIVEAVDTFVRSPGTTAPDAGPQARDVIDLKRVMGMVLLALAPCVVFAVHRYGLARMLPLFAVSYGVGLGIEALFAMIRRTEINEGYFVTGALIPLIVPVTIPLWQLAVAVAFAVVFAKEAFGGTGYNIFNPALVCRAFLFFAYPAHMTGAVWTPPPPAAAQQVDVVTSATPLAVVDAATDRPAGEALADAGYSRRAMFLGDVPGSPGELSKLAILIGAVILIGTGIASVRIIVAGVVGALGTAALVGLIAPSATGVLSLAPWDHVLLGGLLFGIVFMATDPVTSPETATGKWLFGLACGSLTVVIRIASPAYVEGTMLAILLMNAFAPAIDRGVLAANARRRRRRG